ncbi:guanylate kinase [Spongiactinospora sp. TRM90649]|uniref:guanylate kinase n=1 Tax=Spongiactinospora sp. TRM90649 TaxID=3031114 RepID=UPI0023F8E005|nr:guanylate kinase [Spongiactinospora sp. TRM90649]MDF5757637.1 guanylate kinase [Spongiactinospora sp. TRM90649]
MTVRGVILYGPPASGKSTVTAALTDLDPRFELLRKLKVGTGRAEEYDFVTGEELDRLRAAGRIVTETHRYGNRYAIDRHPVEHMARAGLVPVAHVGNCADLKRLAVTGEWLAVLLWLPREVCRARSLRRGDSDTAERLKAWEETLTDLEEHETEQLFHLRLATDRIGSDQAAREIADAFTVLASGSRRPAGHTEGA